MTFCHRLILLAALAVPLPGPALAATVQLADIEAMHEAGAVNLALYELDHVQPDLEAAEWNRAERLRLETYRQQHNWQAIVDRIGQYPERLAPEHNLFTRSLEAEALLAIDEPARAREVLLGLIWSDFATNDQTHHSLWRRMIIESYLREGRLGDAESAILRYRQDYNEVRPEWTMQQARQLLQAGRMNELAALPSGVSTAEARGMRALALIRSGGQPAHEIIAQVQPVLADHALPKDDWSQMLLWLSLYEASQAGRDSFITLSAMEKVVALSRRITPQASLQLPTAAQLWQAYDSYAEELANQAQLLIGDDQGWFELATSRYADSPVQSRALFAALARHSALDENRNFFQHRFINTLRDAADQDLLWSLYLGSEQYQTLPGIPALARALLAEQAMREDNARLAADLLRGQDQAPEGMDEVAWRLLASRVNVGIEDYTTAGQILQRLLQDHPALDQHWIKPLVETIHLLHDAGQSATALGLYDELWGRLDDKQLQHDLLFRMADAKRAMGDYDDAAALYLKAANRGGQEAGQTVPVLALMQAADMLTRAGQLTDAAAIYRRLLGRELDAGTRNMIHIRLDNLREAESSNVSIH